MELLQVQYLGEPGSFRLNGELDLSSLDALGAIRDYPLSEDLRLDIRDLAFVDGAGLDTLARLAAALKGRGDLILYRPTASVERVLQKMAAAKKLSNLVIERDLAADQPARKLPEDLSRVLLSEHSPEEICRSLARRAEERVDGAWHAAITLYDERPILSACTSNRAIELIRLGAGAAGGPSIDAYRLGSVLHIESMIEERRWPEFTASALYTGVASICSVPLKTHEKSFGSLDLFGERERVFSNDDVAWAAGFAVSAAALVTNSRSYWEARELASQLREALASRAVIDQAKGALIATRGLTAEEAFEALRAMSQKSHVKVRDLAAQVLRGEVAQLNGGPSGGDGIPLTHSLSGVD